MMCRTFRVQPSMRQCSINLVAGCFRSSKSSNAFSIFCIKSQTSCLWELSCWCILRSAIRHSLSEPLPMPCRYLWGSSAVAAHRAGALLPVSPEAAAAAVTIRTQVLQGGQSVDAQRVALTAVAPRHPASYDPSFVLPFAALVSCLPDMYP